MNTHDMSLGSSDKVVCSNLALEAPSRMLLVVVGDRKMHRHFLDIFPRDRFVLSWIRRTDAKEDIIRIVERARKAGVDVPGIVETVIKEHLRGAFQSVRVEYLFAFFDISTRRANR